MYLTEGGIGKKYPSTKHKAVFDVSFSIEIPLSADEALTIEQWKSIESKIKTSIKRTILDPEAQIDEVLYLDAEQACENLKGSPVNQLKIRYVQVDNT